MKTRHPEISKNTKIISIRVQEDSKSVSEIETEKVQQDEFANVTMTSARRPYKMHKSRKAYHGLQIASSISNWAKIENLGF